MDIIREIIFHGNAKIYLPTRYYFSFANSPYYAHQYLKAIDMYPELGEATVVSPFNGRMVYYKVIHGEHVSGYRVGDYYIRVLHMKPFLELGKEVKVGDVLGELVDSPYFYPWTDHHMHIEIRGKLEFVRASGGLELQVSEELVECFKKALSRSDALARPVFQGRITSIKKGRYILVRAGYRVEECITPLIINSNNTIGFIDAGLPHYGHGLLISPGNGTNVLSTIKLSNTLIGHIDQQYNGGLHHFRVDHKLFKVFLDNSRTKGIGLYIGFPFIKIIISKWTRISYHEGDIVEIRFENV